MVHGKPLWSAEGTDSLRPHDEDEWDIVSGVGLMALAVPNGHTYGDTDFDSSTFSVSMPGKTSYLKQSLWLRGWMAGLAAELANELHGVRNRSAESAGLREPGVEPGECRAALFAPGSSD